jgi:hypothetical protein
VERPGANDLKIPWLITTVNYHGNFTLLFLGLNYHGKLPWYFIILRYLPPCHGNYLNNLVLQHRMMVLQYNGSK